MLSFCKVVMAAGRSPASCCSLANCSSAAARREFGAVLALHPLDQAQANFDLARACHGEGDAPCAMNAVLAALEVAPDFRPAQKLLLELTGQ